MNIEQYEFKLKNEELEQNEHAKNWPVVYILSGEKEAYVGETANFKRRDVYKRQIMADVFLITV